MYRHVTRCDRCGFEQEVDCFGRWAAALQPHGYKGIYQQRTGDKRDGCAVFFRQSMYPWIAYDVLGNCSNI